MSQLREERNIGIDMLRALSMLFVIWIHLLGKGELVDRSPNAINHYSLSLLQSMAFCAVNVYGLTTGYMMCTKPFRLSRLTQLWAITVFWSVLISCVSFAFFGGSFGDIIAGFFPFLSGRYWFFSAYIVTLAVSPVLNMVITGLTKEKFRLFLFVLLLLFSVLPVFSAQYDAVQLFGGQHFAWMMVLYLLGGYLRRFEGDDQTKRSSPFWGLTGFFCLAFVQLLYKALTNMFGFSDIRNIFLTYQSPLIVGEAICLFQFFKEFYSFSNSQVVKRIVSFVTPGVYSVYVIHVHPDIYHNANLIALLRSWDNWNVVRLLFAVISTSVAIFMACVCMDAIRQYLFRKLHLSQAISSFSNALEAYIRRRIS